MVNRKELLKELYNKNILFILIGGFALRMYNSPRITHVLDLAVRTLDVDDIIDIMYENGYYLVSEIKNTNAFLILSAQEAVDWIESSKAGAMTFVAIHGPEKPAESLYPLDRIDSFTQVDFLFELSIPIMKMKKNAKTIPLDDFQILLASKQDLLVLKEQLKTKTEADYADIEFLKELIKRTGKANL